MIIDTHQHLGRSMFSGVTTSESDLVAAMDAHGVDVMLVMPQPTLDDVRGIHDSIAAAAARHSGRIFGMASISPWLPEGEYLAEARRCVRDLRFRAIKLHPLGHNLPPTHAEADKVFRAADALGVPVIVHTGLGAPWSLPALCIAPARKYKHVSIVLAHAGWGLYSSEAIVAAEVCGNIYVEPSWCPTYSVRQMIDKLGAERVMFGSDHLTNLPVELVKYRSIGLSTEQLEQVMWRTAQRVFGLGT